MAKAIVDFGVPGLTIGDVTWSVCERVRDHVAVSTAGSTLTFIAGSVGSYWIENPNVIEDTQFYVYYSLTTPTPAGVAWTERANPKALSLNGVCWSGTQFVAVGSTDTVTDAYIITSPDGIIWTERANPMPLGLNSICWSGTQFVAVGDPTGGNGYIITSPDGVTWTQRANPGIGALLSVCWSGTQFVAVGLNDATDACIVTSPDGITWTERANPKALFLYSVCWSDTQFVAVGNTDAVTDAYIVTSPDGITWTERANPKAVNLRSVCWSSTQFVAVGDSDGTDAYIITSPDGVTWTERANPGIGTLLSVCWSGTQFVAVGDSDGTDAYIVTSPDGITWTERANPMSLGLNSICWSGTQFVAVGNTDAVTDAYIVTSSAFTTITHPGAVGIFRSISSLGICNNVILSLGGNVITSFDDTTTEGVLCKNLWPQALVALLRLHPWNCAIKRVTLSPDAGVPAYYWTTAFTFPADLLRLLELDGVTEYKIEGRKILCNESTLNIRYVFQNDNLSDWDSLLTEAMTAYMAFKLAYPLTKSNTTRDAQWQLFTNLLRTAKSIDAQEEPGDTMGDFPLINARRR